MTKILVVDDDPPILRFARRALEAEGFQVLTASDGTEGLRLTVTQQPSLVLLDLDLPGLSGTAVLAALLTDTPRRRVLVLGSALDVRNEIRSLDPDSVDFLPKPFAMADLLARVRYRLRGLQETVEEPSDELVWGSLQLNLRTRELRSATRTVELSQREFALMHHLMRRRGSVCTRPELLSQVWGYAFDPGSNVVDVTVARLRSKLKDLHIETIRNVGYALREA